MPDDDVLALDPLVRLAVARSRFADPADLTALAEAPDAEVHDVLAEFAALPADAVSALARSPDPGVRTMLVRNRRLPEAGADLRTALLVDDPSAVVRSELLELDLPVPLRRRVLESLREDQVLHPQPWMPEELLVRIVTGGDDAVRGTAVRCLPADSGLLRSLCSAADPTVRWDAAANPVLPPELRRRLAEDEDADVRRAAIDRSLPTDVLLRLSEDPYAWVRGEAVSACRSIAQGATRSARDVAAAEQVLLRAAHDSDEHVRAEAALHVPVHRLLLDDPSEHVRSSLARTSSDPDLLVRLADDPEPEVVDDVATNPGSPPQLLRRMCVRVAAQWAAGSGLADDEDPREGYGQFRAMDAASLLTRLVGNPALPDGVAAGLLGHRSPAVADAVLVRLGHDPDVVPARTLRLRHRRGLLWQLLALAGAPVHDPAVRRAVLERLPSAAGTVGDLATAVREAR